MYMYSKAFTLDRTTLRLVIGRDETVKFFHPPTKRKISTEKKDSKRKIKKIILYSAFKTRLHHSRQA